MVLHPNASHGLAPPYDAARARRYRLGSATGHRPCAVVHRITRPTAVTGHHRPQKSWSERFRYHARLLALGPACRAVTSCQSNTAHTGSHARPSSALRGWARLVITAVTAEIPRSAKSWSFGVALLWIYALLARCRDESEAALEPQSRRPKITLRSAAPGQLRRF